MTMTLGGWIFMLSSVGFVVGLATWCYHKVLTTGDADEAEAGEPAAGSRTQSR